MTNQHTTSVGSYKNATGAIRFGMTNDYMFRAILQKNQKVLTGLICSLLHLSPDEVRSVNITNPIQPGDDIDAKEFILDIHVMLNDNTLINLEMQVANEYNWPERSLGYLCRAYDQLCRGQDYAETKPVIHIGFLDFTPFNEYPEFYSTYKLLNVKNYQLYSDKFVLSVVDLTQIHLATPEDRKYQIDYWARLFKATTWEEIQMIAENNEYLNEASQTLYELNADEMMQERCYARHCYMQTQNSINRKMNELTAENDTLVDENNALTAKNNVLTTQNDVLTTQNNALTSENQQLNSRLSEKDAEIARLKKLVEGGKFIISLSLSISNVSHVYKYINASQY